MSLSGEEALLGAVKRCPFILAPMAGITDCAFRTFMSELGSPVVVSELISAQGLLHGSDKTFKLAAFDEVQRPYGVQLFGEDVESLGEAAYRMEEFGADFIDLNFGCPVKKVVSKGAGSAILKDLGRLARTLKAVKSRIGIPLTIKIRTGWSEPERNADEVAHIAHEEGVTWVAIHGRTRAAGYSGASDWGYIGEVAGRAKLPIIGNGDITSGELAVQRLKGSGSFAVMIGRGALKNPWIFLDAAAALRGEEPPLERDFQRIFLRLFELYSNWADERVVGIQMKKFASWYSAGLPGSAAFRKLLFQMKTIEEVMDNTISYFEDLKTIQPEDTSHEPFLMGGHG